MESRVILVYVFGCRRSVSWRYGSRDWASCSTRSCRISSASMSTSSARASCVSYQGELWAAGDEGQMSVFAGDYRNYGIQLLEIYKLLLTSNLWVQIDLLRGNYTRLCIGMTFTHVTSWWLCDVIKTVPQTYLLLHHSNMCFPDCWHGTLFWQRHNMLWITDMHISHSRLFSFSKYILVIKALQSECLSECLSRWFACKSKVSSQFIMGQMFWKFIVNQNVEHWGPTCFSLVGIVMGLLRFSGGTNYEHKQDIGKHVSNYW